MPTPDALPSPGDRALAAAADALARRLMERLPAGRAVPRAAIAALPPAVAQPLLARLDARIDREAPAPASPWIDADAARPGARQWRDAARAAARVPAPEWPAFLGDACRLVVSHLVRPAETLAAVAFENAEDAERPTALVMRRLAAFAPYPYLPEIAGQYVARKGIARIDRAALESLLRRIDRRMVAAFSAEEWVGLLEPLFELLEAPDGVAAEVLGALFEARGRDDLGRLFSGSVTPGVLHATLARALPPPAAPRPEREPDPIVAPAAAEIHRPDERFAEPQMHPRRREDDGVEETAPGEGEETAPEEAAPPQTPPEPAGDASETDWRARDPGLSDWLRSASAEPPDSTPATEPLPVLPAELPALRPPWFSNVPGAYEEPNDATLGGEPHDDWSATPSTPTSAAAPDDGEPLWKRMMPAGAAPGAAPEAEPLWKHYARPASDAVPQLPADEPAAERVAEPASEPATSGIQDLEARVLGRPPDAARRAVFVADLFGGSEGDYADTLARLASAASLDAATDIFQRDVLLRHRVNVYSEPAAAFAAAAESRFRPAR